VEEFRHHQPGFLGRVSTEDVELRLGLELIERYSAVGVGVGVNSTSCKVMGLELLERYSAVGVGVNSTSCKVMGLVDCRSKERRQGGKWGRMGANMEGKWTRIEGETSRALKSILSSQLTSSSV